MFDWQRMFFGDLTWAMAAETLFRSVLLYAYTIALFRLLLGKRSISQLSPYEFIIIIALGAAIGEPMVYHDVPILQGMLTITALVLLDRLLVEITSRSRPLEFLLEGRPTRLLVDGRIDVSGMKRAALSRDEIFAALRLQGVEQLGQVKRAYLETNGRISVFLYPREDAHPGLPILPPRESDSKDHLDTAGDGSLVCSECGKPAGASRAGAAWRCPNCGGEERQPAVLDIGGVDEPAER